MSARRLLLPLVAGAAALTAYALTPSTSDAISEARRFMLAEGLPERASIATDTCAVEVSHVRCEVILPCGATGIVRAAIVDGRATGFVGNPAADLAGLCPAGAA